MVVGMLQKMQLVDGDSVVSPVCLNHALSREGKSLCIEDLNNDVQRDSKLTYSGTERHTVAEKMGATRIVRVHSLYLAAFCQD